MRVRLKSCTIMVRDDKKHEPFRREGGEQTKMIDEDTMQPNGNDEEEEKEESKDEESSE